MSASLLVVGGSGGAWAWGARFVSAAGIVGGALVARFSPFLDGQPNGVRGSLALVCGLVALGFAFVLDRRARACGALVDFRDVGIRFSWPGFLVASRAVRWTDLEGFRDGSSDWVELVPKTKPSLGTTPLRVPTLDERARLAVLELLDRRGLARLEG